MRVHAGKSLNFTPREASALHVNFLPLLSPSATWTHHSCTTSNRIKVKEATMSHQTNSKSELIKWLGTRPSLYTVKDQYLSLVMNMAEVLENEEIQLKLVIMELTDGDYWLPVTMPKETLETALNISSSTKEELGERLEPLANTNLMITKWMVGVYRRGEALAPYLLINELVFNNTSAATPRTPREICYNPRVNSWLMDVQNQLLNLTFDLNDKDWVMPLYPKSRIPGMTQDEFYKFHPAVEELLLYRYGALPSLAEIEEQIRPLSKTFKKRHANRESVGRDPPSRPAKQVKTQHQQSLLSQYCPPLTRGDVKDIFDSFDTIDDSDCIIPPDQLAILASFDGASPILQTIIKQENVATDDNPNNHQAVLPYSVATSQIPPNKLHNDDQQRRSDISDQQGVAAVAAGVVRSASNVVDDRQHQGLDITERNEGEQDENHDEDEYDDAEEGGMDNMDPTEFWEAQHISYVDMVDGFKSKMCLLF
ncbi:hypothetical protein BDB00DRAFT_827428 [Zychaea mexicana]|uniref:uncharacterized protein n=1 Tax=Zychaea mexicana TaxID=64656 RepID=UPI0022FEF954|nr:uncharacterized protein BDB00DRAFT_827428 [Zychaea mexicana]KAI9492626.1 hypothetical protein BDB00DRAFT_827428 [Zychaea mexicana]